MSSSPSGTQVHASQDFWEVEEILKETAYRYLVKWVGLDPETRKPWPDSWVAKVDCTKELIAEWKKKQKEKKRKNKAKETVAFRASGSRTVAPSKSRSASGRTSRTSTPVKKPLSPKSPTPPVQLPRLEKRKQHSSDNTPDSEEEEQPQKRRKTTKKEFNNQSPTTIRVGPPGRAINYIVNHGSHEPIVTYKKAGGARKRALARVSERDGSFCGSSDSRESPQSDRSVEDEEVDDDRVSSQPQPQPQPQPVSFKQSPSKNGFTQEIIEETQPYESPSSSQSTPHHSLINLDHDDEKQAVLKQSPKRTKSLSAIPSPIQSQHTLQSPIDTFGSSIKTSPSKQNISMHPTDADDIDSDDAPQRHRQESDPRLFEKQEEEESQSQSHPYPYPQEEDGEEEKSAFASRKPSLSTTASSIPSDVIDDIHKLSSSKSALISVFARLGKVFGAMESDDIEASNSRVGRTKERPLSPEVDKHEKSDDHPPIEHEEGEYVRESDEIRDSGDHPYVADADMDELDADVDDDDELGPDDAADNITSSVPESQNHRVNSSMLVNAATTQHTLPPVIESPVRQLDSALGLLHRKSEEIQMLRDQVIQLQEAVGKSGHRINQLEKELDQSEEQREAQGLQVAQLEVELVSAKSEAAVNAVRTALNPEEPSSSMEESAVVSGGDDMADASELDSTLIQLQDEIERHKMKIADLERENNVFRNLYTQASTAHLNNLDELKELKRDNTSLREQATSGVRQANLFWKTQVATLENRLKQAKGETQLMVHQNRATQDIRDRAALFSMAQKETANVQKELDEWKERFGKLGMENTELRIELKRRDDEDLTRRRKQREMDEQNKRALENGDQLLWICPWRDDKYEKCNAFLDSREALRDHFLEAGHV